MILQLHHAVAAHAAAHGMPITAAAVAEIDELLAEQRASDRQSQGSGGRVEFAGFHTDRMPEGGARHHVR